MSNVKMSSSLINDYPHSVPYETIPSVAGFSLVLSHVLCYFLWHLYQKR